MELKKLSFEEYQNIFPNHYHAFNKPAFNALNAERLNLEVDYIGFKSSKFKLGIIGGFINSIFKSPFSAPFGAFSFAKVDVELESIEEAVDLLINYCSNNNASEIRLTLPPLFYNFTFISKLSNVLYRKKFSISSSDLNYSIHLEDAKENYLEILHYNAKKNLNIALTKEFEFLKCETLAEKASAYEIISRNRKSRGFPLKMTWETVLQTISIIKADFFLLKLADQFVASAIVFYVTETIVQVIYWGDLPEYAMNKTMNYLSYQIVNYFSHNGIKIIDIGPSTEDSVPNYGLGNFKESIGSKVFPKQSFNLML